jgi:broad specificity phosphatase PhoE
MRCVEIRRHTMRTKPGQHLSQAGVDLARLVGGQIGPFDRVVTSTIPRAFETAIAMGFAVDDVDDAIAMMDDDVDAEVSWPADFVTWAEAIRKGGAASRYAYGLSAFMNSIAHNLPDDGTALLISHGGIVEASAVASVMNADHAAWGSYIRCCEGVRLVHDGEQFIRAQVLRVPLAPES